MTQNWNHEDHGLSPYLPSGNFVTLGWSFNYSKFLISQTQSRNNKASVIRVVLETNQTMREETSLNYKVLGFTSSITKCLLIMLTTISVLQESIRRTVPDRAFMDLSGGETLSLRLFSSQRYFIVVLGSKINIWGNNYEVIFSLSHCNKREIMLCGSSSYQSHRDTYSNYWTLSTLPMANIS